MYSKDKECFIKGLLSVIKIWMLDHTFCHHTFHVLLFFYGHLNMCKSFQGCSKKNTGLILMVKNLKKKTGACVCKRLQLFSSCSHLLSSLINGKNTSVRHKQKFQDGKMKYLNKHFSSSSLLPTLWWTIQHSLWGIHTFVEPLLSSEDIGI
jgi:hypothetical protein